MKINVIDSYADFKALEDNWNSVYVTDPFAQFFMSWTWFSRIFEEYPSEWRVLAAKSPTDPGSYVGFFPINLKTIWSERKNQFRNELHLAGTLFWSQYTGFVCDPEWDEIAIPSFAEKIQELYWSRLSLKYIYASDSRISQFTSAFNKEHFKTTQHERWINKGQTNNLICPYIELPDDYDTYLQSYLSTNTRQKIRRYTRKIEASDEFYFTTSSADTVARDVDILIGFWLDKWSESKGDKSAGLARKFRRILNHGFNADSLHLPILWHGNTPLAAIANFVDWEKRSVFFFVTGRDEQREEKWIGLMLNAHCIRWAIENRMEIYDFCHGNEAYKYSYGAKDRLLKHIVVSHRPGVNVNGILDPQCVESVMEQTIKFIESNELDKAKIACKQIRDVSRSRVSASE
ncbi:MAG: hypothetical protein ACI8VW_002752 [bacterium]